MHITFQIENWFEIILTMLIPFLKKVFLFLSLYGRFRFTFWKNNFFFLSLCVLSSFPLGYCNIWSFFLISFFDFCPARVRDVFLSVLVFWLSFLFPYVGDSFSISEILWRPYFSNYSFDLFFPILFPSPGQIREVGGVKGKGEREQQ